jgi:hypothetical protein
MAENKSKGYVFQVRHQMLTRVQDLQAMLMNPLTFLPCFLNLPSLPRFRALPDGDDRPRSLPRLHDRRGPNHVRRPDLRRVEAWIRRDRWLCEGSLGFVCWCVERGKFDDYMFMTLSLAELGWRN